MVPHIAHFGVFAIYMTPPPPFNPKCLYVWPSCVGPYNIISVFPFSLNAAEIIFFCSHTAGLIFSLYIGQCRKQVQGAANVIP